MTILKGLINITRKLLTIVANKSNHLISPSCFNFLYCSTEIKAALLMIYIFAYLLSILMSSILSLRKIILGADLSSVIVDSMPQIA